VNMWKSERNCFERGFSFVCGVDEAGAGPLAGPVCAAAVILPPNLYLEGLNDSKQVSEKKREVLFEQIINCAVTWSVSLVEAWEIDELDILNARIKAMQMAIDGLNPAAEFALIDGNRDHGSRCEIKTAHKLLVKGDSRSASIAAASILAKVSRDRKMEELEKVYPGYGFAKHKGYGTKAHYEALDRIGPCPVHRESFLRKWRESRR